jgi:hypothetical protein
VIDVQQHPPSGHVVHWQQFQRQQPIERGVRLNRQAPKDLRECGGSIDVRRPGAVSVITPRVGNSLPTPLS